MADVVVLCTDGSEASLGALRSGLHVVRAGVEPVIVTVAEPSDPMLLAGTGMAAGTMSPQAYDDMEKARHAEAHRVVEATADALDLAGARREVLEGDPATALCQFATDTSAIAIVIGTRGQGGIKRAVLGSVSDQVVRHAPCPVVVTTHHHG
jgi:nucleotide-binding universal stress UspA family protein